MPVPDEAKLDDPVYGALTGPHARFAEVSGRTRRYPSDVAPFLALPPAPTARDWADAIPLVPPGTIAAVLHADGELPAPWSIVREFEVVQMVGDHAEGAPEPEAVTLGPDDVPEILELVDATDPGPFLPRTIELGTYLGIRRGGALIAMAGERMHLDGWREISAVCTHPEHRGEGLASRLIGALIDGTERCSERAFLHVLSSNATAIHLYEQLGFRVRQRAAIRVITRGSTPNAL